MAAASPAGAAADFSFTRLEGATRYETAARIAASAFPTGTDVAVLARADVFADALAANYLAGAVDAPVLLTTSRSLPAATAAALGSLGVSEVVIVGGPVAVSHAVEDELLDEGYLVDRLEGADRYETAAEVAAAAWLERGQVVGELDGLRTAILGSGQSFPDVLAAAPISFARNHPLLITPAGGLPDSTAEALIGLDIEQVVIVGGTTVVSSAVADEVQELTGRAPIRLFGATRYETAAAIAERAYDDFEFDATHVNLARGDNFADALAGGPHAGKDLAPILLTAPTTLSAATGAFLAAHSPTLLDGHIFGGLNAVSSTVETAAEAAATGDVSNPAAATVTSPAAAVATNQPTFTITGTAEAGATVRVLRADGRTEAATGTAGSTGAFSIATPLVDGANRFVVVVRDAAGNVSPDTTVPVITQDTARPTAVLAVGGPGTNTFTVTYNELIQNSTASLQDFTRNGVELNSTTASRETVANSSGQDVTTVTLVTPLAAGDVIVLEADAVLDLAGNRGPATAQTATVDDTPSNPGA